MTNKWWIVAMGLCQLLMVAMGCVHGYSQQMYHRIGVKPQKVKVTSVTRRARYFHCIEIVCQFLFQYHLHQVVIFRTSSYWTSGKSAAISAGVLRVEYLLSNVLGMTQPLTNIVPTNDAGIHFAIIVNMRLGSLGSLGVSRSFVDEPIIMNGRSRHFSPH